MDNTLIAAIIGAGGAVLGGVASRTDSFDRLLKGGKHGDLTGQWTSTWQETTGGKTIQVNEKFIIEKHRGDRVYGYITMDTDPDKKWELEGIFLKGRFLQLFWYPSKTALNKDFVDHGCYFFVRLYDGTFEGYSVGPDWPDDKIAVYKHTLKRIPR